MNVIADTWPAFTHQDGEAPFAHGVLHALPAALPDHQFQYLEETDESKVFAYPNVRGINPLDNPAGDVFFSPDSSLFNGDIPQVVGILNVDHLRFPLKYWYHFGRMPKDHLPDMLRQSTRLVVPHQGLKDILLHHYQVPAEKVTIVGHGPPTGDQQTGPVDEVTRRITKEVYGRENAYFLVPLQGHPSDNLGRLLQAYQQFRNRCPEQVLLLLAGREKKQPRTLRNAVKKHPFSKDIVWLPRLSAHEGKKVFASARAVLHPSLSSRFPIPLLQAWSAEVPVLSTHREILAGAGALVQGEDVNSIAEGMVSLVTTPFLASGLVENGKHRLKDFSWKTVAEKVAEVLREVADQSSPRSSEQ